jgi:hypothetical protein
MGVTVRAYLSPTLVLLAFDYPEGANAKNFLGFAIKREPGFDGASSTFLSNRIGFNGARAMEAPRAAINGQFKNSIGGTRASIRLIEARNSPTRSVWSRARPAH